MTVIITLLHLTFCSTSLLILSSWVLPVEVRYLICDWETSAFVPGPAHIQSLQDHSRACISRIHREQNSASPRAYPKISGSLPKCQQASHCTENCKPHCRLFVHNLATVRAPSVAAKTGFEISRCTCVKWNSSTHLFQAQSRAFTSQRFSR